MKKNELKSGMVVECRGYGKIKWLVVGDNLVGEYSYSPLSNYSDDLKAELKTERIRNFDIMKVYKYKKLVRFRELLEDDNLELIWERKEIKLTDKEIEILKALKVLGFKFLARDENDYLHAYNMKRDWDFNAGVRYQQYINISVNNDVFDFIKWEDKEPTKIDDLLKGVAK